MTDTATTTTAVTAQEIERALRARYGDGPYISPVDLQILAATAQIALVAANTYRRKEVTQRLILFFEGLGRELGLPLRYRFDRRVDRELAFDILSLVVWHLHPDRLAAAIRVLAR